MPLDRRETQDWLRSGGPTCLRPNPTPHMYSGFRHLSSNPLVGIFVKVFFFAYGVYVLFVQSSLRNCSPLKGTF
uniref:Uncharacterized protein n=1 Tax=Mesocestoides corti TaxID=53468 RepID=A0A5K3FNU2_MESCO